MSSSLLLVPEIPAHVKTFGTRNNIISNNDLAILKVISQSITLFYSSAEGKESLPSKTGENSRTSSYHNVQVGAVRLPFLKSKLFIVL